MPGWGGRPLNREFLEKLGRRGERLTAEEEEFVIERKQAEAIQRGLSYEEFLMELRGETER